MDRNIQLAASGDLDAFEEIYKAYNRRVYTQCLRMTRNVHEAEDLTQEVFIQLFRKLNTFRGESLFTTWLHKLTMNTVLMHFRKVAVRLERTTEDGEEPVYKLASGMERSNTTTLVDRISLDEAIRQLAPGYRAVFILHDVEGYEHHQISELLGCAIGTSKSQLYKARAKLRSLLSRKKWVAQSGSLVCCGATPNGNSALPW